VFLRKFRRRLGRTGTIEAVVENLNNILNTKKGYGSFVREMGIGDWNEYRSRDKIIGTIIEEIKENVRLFEPRVSLNEIEEVDSGSPFRIRFEVQCVFNEGARPIFIVLDSQQDRVSVEV
jgi:type VI secretion system protein